MRLVDFRNLRCPYCGREVWTSDMGAVCVQPNSGGADGCGAKWDACGNPTAAPRDGVAPDDDTEVLKRLREAVGDLLDVLQHGEIRRDDPEAADLARLISREWRP